MLENQLNLLATEKEQWLLLNLQYPQELHGGLSNHGRYSANGNQRTHQKPELRTNWIFFKFSLKKKNLNYNIISIKLYNGAFLCTSHPAQWGRESAKLIPLSRPGPLFSLKSRLPAGRPNLKQDQGSQRGVTSMPRTGNSQSPYPLPAQIYAQIGHLQTWAPTEDGDLQRLPPAGTSVGTETPPPFPSR